MTTKKQAAANRRNAKKSTGPRTDEGKASSSQNALKHGLSAEQVVIWDEDPAAFEALRFDLIQHFQPANPMAYILVEQLAGYIWRLMRVPKIEAAIYSYFTLEATYESEDEDENEEVYAYGDAITNVIKGEVFELAERPLTSLIRLAGRLEGSMYRSIRELERMKAERSDSTNQSPVIDAEPEQQHVIPRSRPHQQKPAEAKPEQQAVIPRPRLHRRKPAESKPEQQAVIPRPRPHRRKPAEPKPKEQPAISPKAQKSKGARELDEKRRSDLGELLKKMPKRPEKS